jgi:transposase
MILEELFCRIDDFCKEFMPLWEAELIAQGIARKTWQCQMSASEIMTILVLFHQQQYRNFKAFFKAHVSIHLRKAFPFLLSYSRFVEQMKRITMPLFFFLMSLPKIKTGIYFIDSTTIKVCHIKREKQHKVFKGLARKSKSTMGWFFGFKLHILINSSGEIIALKFTEANVDDREPVLDMTDGILGKMFADKGYISKALREKLLEKGIELVTKVRKNMKTIDRSDFDKLLLRKRSIVESVIDQLKNISQIEHTRHRSVLNFLVNLISGLTAYGLQHKKPSLDLGCNGLVAV